MSILNDLDLAFDPAGWIGRRGDAGRISLRPTEVRILSYIDTTPLPTVDGLIAAELPGASPDWVRGFIDKLSTKLSAVGLRLSVSPSGTIEITLPSAPVAATATPAHGRTVGARAAGQLEHIAALQRQIDDQRGEIEGMSATLAEHETEMAQAREAIAGHAKAARYWQEMAETLGTQLRAAIAGREEVERQLAAAQQAAPAAPLRDSPVMLAPRHVTIPVSESLYRWLEGMALRNRCSPEHIAARLILAFRKAAVDEAADKRGRAA